MNDELKEKIFYELKDNFYKNKRLDRMLISNLRTKIVDYCGHKSSFFTIDFFKFVFSIIEVENKHSINLISFKINDNDKLINLSQMNLFISDLYDCSFDDDFNHLLSLILIRLGRIITQYKSNFNICRFFNNNYYFTNNVSLLIFNEFDEYKKNVLEIKNKDIKKKIENDKRKKLLDLKKSNDIKVITNDLLYIKMLDIERKLDEVINNKNKL